MLKKLLRSIACAGTLVASALAQQSACATNYPPADHLGADLTLANGDIIWGEHTNIGTLTIPTTATVHVAKHDFGTTSAKGDLTFVAQHVILNGTINATGCAYVGGYSGFYNPFSGSCYAGGNGEGPYAGTNETFDDASACEGIEPGGYMGCGSNADVTTDTTITSGSGALGTIGCRSFNYDGPGGAGGGAIRLVANSTFASGPMAHLFANGEVLQDTYWNNAGAPGAGGGILVDTRGATAVSIASGLSLEAKGGGWDIPDYGRAANGGTVKLFIPSSVETKAISVSAGRLFRPIDSVPVSMELVDQRCPVSLGSYNCKVTAVVHYVNNSTTPVTGDDYAVWIIDDPSQATLYQNPDWDIYPHWDPNRPKQGKIGRLKPGASKQLRLKLRTSIDNKGKYLLWRLRHLDIYAVAGPLQ
jgi:hypothetical protein